MAIQTVKHFMTTRLKQAFFRRLLATFNRLIFEMIKANWFLITCRLMEQNGYVVSTQRRHVHIK